MSNKSADGAPPAGVQSVDRAASILQILARRGEAGVSEVAAEVGVHKSTAFRLLAALEGRDLVEQAEDRGKYRLGFGIIRLAGAVSGRMDVVSQGRSVCERLSRDAGETVNIAVAQSRYAVNVDQVRGPSSVATHNWVGQLTPLHATASGKVLLAELDDLRLAAVVGAGLERFTEQTITTAAGLDRELEVTRRRGYALTVEEYEAGLNAVAAPVRSYRGEVVAAVSVSGPAFRMTPERIDALLPALLTAAAEISRRMGHQA